MLVESWYGFGSGAVCLRPPPSLPFLGARVFLSRFALRGSTLLGLRLFATLTYAFAAARRLRPSVPVESLPAHLSLCHGASVFVHFATVRLRALSPPYSPVHDHLCPVLRPYSVSLLLILCSSGLHRSLLFRPRARYFALPLPCCPLCTLLCCWLFLLSPAFFLLFRLTLDHRLLRFPPPPALSAPPGLQLSLAPVFLLPLVLPPARSVAFPHPLVPLYFFRMPV